MFGRTAAVLALALAGVAAWFRFSAWPVVMVIRAAFEHGAKKTAERLERHLPAGGHAETGLRFGSGDSGGTLDMHYPEPPGTATAELPVVVWVHGGGWISGRSSDIGNYLRILASRGVVAVAVEYTIAPGGKYPVPVEQVNRALGFLEQNANELHIDPARIVLAGDSAGAQIAGQVALLDSQPGYARRVGIPRGLDAARVRGVLLNCGIYDLDLAPGTRLHRWFLRNVLWSYSGSRNFRDDDRFRLASIHNEIDHRFPPVFITAGNRDPLLPHSERLAEKLTGLGVPVDALLFPPDHEPGLDHEYQFDLDLPEGREALERMVRFIRRNT